MRTWTVFSIALACGLAGCTHTQLRHNTVHQSETTSDIYTQQVLDNLAMFIYDSNSLPFFAFPKEGINRVTDSGTSKLALAFPGVGLDTTAKRDLLQSWTLTPIRDPHKLMRMRCTYQHAVAWYNEEAVSKDCPQCDAILKTFYGSSEHAGGVDVDCIEGWKEDPGWFNVSCKKPECCGCELVGHYCGVYVWVSPGNRDKLSQLTMAILDHALFEPAEKVAAATKQVVVTVVRDKDDNITSTTRQETFSEPVDKEAKPIFRPGRRTEPSRFPFFSSPAQFRQRLDFIGPSS